jgi:hypothetical protein
MTSFSEYDDLTLGEAIDRVRGEEDPDGAITRGLSTDSARAIDMHDTVHILFRCDTSLAGEIAAHVWMAFGTTAKLSEMHRAVANQEHRKALAGIGHGVALRTWLVMLPRIVEIIATTRKMTQRLPYEGLDQLKRMRVAVIRQNYGII